MVGVNFKGRLGNQLFQFYFFLYLKSRNRKLIYFFPNPHHAYIEKYFDLGWYNLILGSKVYSVITRVLARIWGFKEVCLQNLVAPKEIEVLDDAIYNGYFQTDWYLKRLDKPYRISVKKKYRERFQKEFGSLFRENRTIAVHIRRTDYLTYGKRDISIPVSFFKRELSRIDNIDQYKVIFVSDDIAYVKEQFGTADNYLFSENDEITDFQLIQHADIAIISNSTFSWWAAYLSEKDNRVIAPANWLGFNVKREHPKGIMTDRFIWRDVFHEN
ncbi:alpha-1,2-fucosyltransferase [Arcticibacter sp. MXS-1]|uniref:alpha-1,2-fucosyltransferase n=1 Tax=Arcticibacter sp. MXS-1 TaxID=3341726 RepID=UPI0035A82C88